ncbi:MAG: tetratricopeptide repeat protein [Armatimonadetes bacterium]|nr:tetratricopeptide repeat protein [Armatimonadota bacterium]MDW8028859.1 tetratricopeptide repeat protein [Armatimonadota bacterium]
MWRRKFTSPSPRKMAKVQKRSKPQWLEKLLPIWERFKAHLLFHLGVNALHRGKYQKAAEILERVAKVLTDDPFVQLHLGWAHWNLGHPVTARRHLLRATELEPNNPSFWTLAGKLMALRGKWDEAEQLLRQAVQLAPQNLVAQSWLALVLFHLGREKEAIEILKQFPVADDPYLQARLILHLERVALQQDGKGNISFAPVPIWLKVPLLGQFIGWLLRWRGERLIEDGRWESAAKWLNLASQLRPNDHWAKLFQAIALLESGFSEQAEHVLEQVPDSIPEKAWVQGALLVRQKKVREAVPWLSKSDPYHPFVRYYLALALDWFGEAEYACASHLEPLYREDPASLRQRIRELLRWLEQGVEK